MASAPRRLTDMPVRPWRAPAARSYFPYPVYRRAAPTLPPDEPVPGEGEPWEAVTTTRPDTAFVRAVRFLNAFGDLLAVALVVGSMDLSLPRLTQADEDLRRYQISSAPRIEPRC